MNKYTLYKITSGNQVYVWNIYSKSNIIHIVFGIIGGVMQTVEEQVEVNQSGRSLLEQIDSRMMSRINKQIDKGYRLSIEEAKLNIGMNSMDLLKPMLAQRFDKISGIDYSNCFIQMKYNGHRCIITNTGEEIIAYSRNGKPIESIGHILKGINLRPGQTLDGELYIHNTPLQDLGSLIRRKQPGSVMLQYVAYDYMADISYQHRLDILRYNDWGSNITVAPTKIWTPNVVLKDELDESIHDGYEGLILRHGDKGYEAGKRSNSLVKVKKCMDQEFLVINILPSKDGWAILECNVGTKSFRVSAPGTIENKYHIYNNKEKYIGRWITVEFFEWTNDGKPFHPSAIDWMTDI